MAMMVLMVAARTIMMTVALLNCKILSNAVPRTSSIQASTGRVPHRRFRVLGITVSLGAKDTLMILI